MYSHCHNYMFVLDCFWRGLKANNFSASVGPFLELVTVCFSCHHPYPSCAEQTELARNRSLLPDVDPSGIGLWDPWVFWRLQCLLP